MTSLRKLGSSDLEVFPLSLGGNVFGWTADEATSFAVLDAYTAAGGNFVDTADTYSSWVEGNSGGESETVIGNWLAARGNRDDVVIATKVSQHPDYPGLTAGNIKAAADASLQRLRTDRIDLYYTHFDKPEVPVEEIIGALDELVKAGKVRAIGASNISAARLSESLAFSDREGLARYVALQPHYNLVSRDTYEGELESVASRRGPGRRPVLRPRLRVPHRQVPPGRDGRQCAGRGRRKAPGDRTRPEGPRGPGRHRRGPHGPGRHGRPRLARGPADGRGPDRLRPHGGTAAALLGVGELTLTEEEVARLTEASA